MRMKMALPAHNKKMNTQLKHKLCKEPGCGREFMGHAIAKFCPIHADPRKRVRIKPKYIDYANKPIPIKCAPDGEPITIESKCGLEGCGNMFRFQIFPHFTVMPRFCDLHRTIHQRSHFQRMQRKAA